MLAARSLAPATRSLASTAAALARARSLTDALFRQVRPEAIFDRPIPERHRILFYIGHLEAFDWNQIARSCLGLGPLNPELDKLFAFGIDPPMGQSPNDRPEDWPTPAQTREYVHDVRRRLDLLLEHARDQPLQIAIEHRLMHAETFSYILHNLPYGRRHLESHQAAPYGPSPATEMIAIPSGQATLGRRRGQGFGWDNEFVAHSKSVPAFAISKYKISNADYLKFVKDGGPAPHYWSNREGKWFYRGMGAEIPLPENWPVYVNQIQAESYAQWIGKSLPSEEQFHRAAYGTPEGNELDYPWGSAPPQSLHGNFDFHHSDAVSVTSHPLGDSAFGVSQLVGNGWEWTSSPFEPFPGFEPFASYPGYSKDFFDGDHFVLKGGSCATDAQLLRASFRNWYRRDYPYAYATFRVVD